MKRLTTVVSGAPDSRSLVEYLRQIFSALNQAADGRLREFVDVTGTYTAGENDHVVQVAPSGTCTVTLPAPSGMRNKTVTVKRTNGTAHTITVQSASGNIDGSASVTLTSAWQVRHFYSDGSLWTTH